MPYKLLLSEEIAPAIRRIALEQITKARRELSAAQNIQAGVLQTRKCMKRVRSLLRLARPILGERFFKQQNRTYRDIGRALAHPRQAGALLETVIRFEASADFAAEAPLLNAVKQQLLTEKSLREEEHELVALTALIETLDKNAAAWKDLKMPDAQFSDLAAGFGMSYQRGRKSLRRAIRSRETFYLHEWRKDVQQCWRQLQILTLLWPDDVMPRIRLAREISKLLGTEHDLSELTTYIKTHKHSLDKQMLEIHNSGKKADIKQMRKNFARATKSIQRDLCLHAVERGRRLYALDPQALLEAMSIYWQTGKAVQPMPGVVRLLADIAPQSPSRRHDQ